MLGFFNAAAGAVFDYIDDPSAYPIFSGSAMLLVFISPLIACLLFADVPDKKDKYFGQQESFYILVNADTFHILNEPINEKHLGQSKTDISPPEKRELRPK